MYPRLEVDYLPPRLQIGRKYVSYLHGYEHGGGSYPLAEVDHHLYSYNQEGGILFPEVDHHLHGYM